ncbi:synaptophysin 1 [Paramuricea clavata]|uniref:Synaptophysin 1 n=1 Tax=Paramuricea clavata TaxID=317549 RepID=A0A6S7GD16_PARCT|nr:synaptophysin 1 [Paramuricea clavata]
MNRNVNYAVFKEPRAFIKILEIGIAIFAFSTTAGYYSEFKVSSSLRPGKECIVNSTGVKHDDILYKVEGKFEYPFDDDMVYTFYGSHTGKIIHNCTNVTKPVDKAALDVAAKHKSEAQFFVFTGVLSFLYCLFACLYYAILENPSENMYSTDVGRFSWVVVDFLMSVLITIFWFAGSAAWAAGLPGLKDDTGPDTFIDKNPILCQGILLCDVDKEPNYATLKVSIILGFLNLFVWLGNLWFLFKETPWHNPQRDEFQNESIWPRVSSVKLPGGRFVRTIL